MLEKKKYVLTVLIFVSIAFMGVLSFSCIKINPKNTCFSKLKIGILELEEYKSKLQSVKYLEGQNTIEFVVSQKMHSDLDVTREFLETSLNIAIDVCEDESGGNIHKSTQFRYRAVSIDLEDNHAGTILTKTTDPSTLLWQPSYSVLVLKKSRKNEKK